MENKTAAEPQCTEDTAQESGMLFQVDETQADVCKGGLGAFHGRPIVLIVRAYFCIATTGSCTRLLNQSWR